jgi:hypothetical protein
MRALVGRALAASLLVTFVASPAMADDLDLAIADARGQTLPLNPAAEQLAESSAAAQAAAGKIFHADLMPALGPCAAVGEVVGVGPDIATVVSLLVQSPSHWHIISDREFTAIGSGQVRGNDGRVYVSVVFCVETPPNPPPPPPLPTTIPPPVEPPPKKALPLFRQADPPVLTSPDGFVEVSVHIGITEFTPPWEWKLFPVPAVA